MYGNRYRMYVCMYVCVCIYICIYTQYHLYQKFVTSGSRVTVGPWDLVHAAVHVCLALFHGTPCPAGCVGPLVKSTRIQSENPQIGAPLFNQVNPEKQL